MAKHLSIVGVVQGVGYRAWFQSQANALRLSGWVRNRIDGSVEAVVRGDAQAVEEMIALARRGPAAARVQQVSLTEIDDASIPRPGIEMRATQ